MYLGHNFVTLYWHIVIKRYTIFQCCSLVLTDQKANAAKGNGVAAILKMEENVCVLSALEHVTTHSNLKVKDSAGVTRKVSVFNNFKFFNQCNFG